jgi:signal transduction histidine kinase
MYNSTMPNADHKEQELRQLTETLLQAVLDPVLVLDQEWKLRLYNPAAAALFRLTDASLGKSLQDVTQSAALAAFAMQNQPLAEWSPAGESQPLIAYTPQVQPVRNPGGWVLILRDISPLKQLNHTQSEFIRILCHDLRSPLTSIKGFASMMESGTVGTINEKQAHFLERILAGVAQITAQVDNIQDAGRFDPETGFYEMRRSPCDLSAIISKSVREHLLPAEKQETIISVSVSDDVPIINADSLMLERAIANLIDNAIKYTPNGGRIDVGVRRINQHVDIAVRDDGYGISPENQKQLFQRHFRIPRQEHKKVKGTGLGLFIVKSVARRHGGDARVESAEGKGSTFVLSIPLKGANLLSPPESD